MHRTVARRLLSSGVFLVVILLFAAACVRGVRRPGQPLTVFLSGDCGVDDLGRAATAVAARRVLNPCIWVAGGEVVADRVTAALGGGEASLRLMAGAGVDAVLIGPAWLERGPAAARALADDAGLYVLGANILDSAGVAVGHPFMVRRVGLESVGCVGLVQDTSDIRFRLEAIRTADPEFMLSKTVPLLRRRTETVGVVTSGPLEAAGSGVDFVLGMASEKVLAVPLPGRGRIARLDMVLQGGRVVDHSVHEEELAGYPVASEFGALRDSVMARLDSAGDRRVVEVTTAVPPVALTRGIVDGVLRERYDAFVFDRPLASDTLRPGMLTCSRLVELLTETGNLVHIVVDGAGVRSLLADGVVEIEWRHGLRQRRLLAHSEYHVAMTPGFLSRHPELASGGYRVDEEELWRVAVRVLGADGGGS